MERSKLLVSGEDLADAFVIAEQLRLFGLQVRACSLDEVIRHVTSIAVCVIVHAGDVRRLQSLLMAELLTQAADRTIILSAHLAPDDAAQLDRMGAKHFLVRGHDLTMLRRQIASISPALAKAAQQSTRRARQLVAASLHSTTQAFEVYGKGARLTEKDFAPLLDSFESGLAETGLTLLLDMICREQNSTLQHCSLVTTLVARFVALLGFNHADTRSMLLGAFLHDIGKCRIPVTILDKPGRLTDEEMALMRRHAEMGYDLLIEDTFTGGIIAEIALLHHEYLDGSGYPFGLSGSEVPDPVRLITVCDVFAALIERRAYKAPMPAAEAYRVLTDMGPKLDQAIVRAFEPVALLQVDG